MDKARRDDLIQRSQSLVSKAGILADMSYLTVLDACLIHDYPIEQVAWKQTVTVAGCFAAMSVVAAGAPEKVVREIQQVVESDLQDRIGRYAIGTMDQISEVVISKKPACDNFVDLVTTSVADWVIREIGGSASVDLVQVLYAIIERGVCVEMMRYWAM
ncbi:MAG: hypothetical protein H6808_05405 [Phycisphaera sp.]|nr:hypothetical protein [Phycisphaera sp.]